jgi:hypothetical protein
VYFRLSPDSLISTIQLAVLYNFQHSLTLNKGLLLIRDTKEAVASLIALGCLMIPWLGECTCEVMVLDIQFRNSYRKDQSQSPWGIIMDKESLRCYILSLHIYGFHQKSNTDSHSWVSSSSCTYRALSTFWENRDHNGLHNKLPHTMEEWP